MADSVLNVDLLHRAHRHVRALSERESPLPGMLTRAGDAGLLLVDSQKVPDWSAWSIRGEHIWSPTDVARTENGHAVVLEWCEETLAAFLARRRAMGVQLTAGEGIALAVSVLRGLGSCRAAVLHEGFAEEPGKQRGTWWLLHDGRPVIVLDRGDQIDHACRVALAAVADLCSDEPVSRFVRRLAETVEQLMVRDDFAVAVRGCFALGEPAPLHRPARQPLLAQQRGTPVTGRSEHAPSSGLPDASAGRVLLGFVPAELRAAVQRTLDRVDEARERRGRRVPRRQASRFAPWLFGAALMGVILAVGLLVPSGNGDARERAADAIPDATERTVEPEGESLSAAAGEDAASGEETAAPHSATASAEAEQPGPQDPLERARGFLDHVDRCAGLAPPGPIAPSVVQQDCIDALLAQPDQEPLIHGERADAIAALLDRVVTTASSDRALTLLEDFGDVSVVAVRAVDETDASDAEIETIVLVLERDGSGVLLRDAYVLPA